MIFVAVRGWWEQTKGRLTSRVFCMCEAISIKRAHAHTQSTGSTYLSKKKKKVKYFWIYETLKKTIVFMFYCKDVNYDMRELEKKS